MMRMAGIPARIVTGYQGGWYSQSANYFLVRQSDAHAWSEVWLEGSGWTRVDPTAAVSPLRVERGSIDAMDQPRHLLDFNWIRNLRNAVDVMEKRWNTWVINYDHKQQSQLFSGLGLEQLRPIGLVTLLFAVLGVLGLILMPVLLRTRGPRRKDPLQQAWQKFLKQLEKAGFQPKPSQGALELAAAAAVELPEQSASIYQVADLYSRCRYDAKPPKLHEFREAVRRYRAQARGR
jgi:hypothetical protein